ncbi:MAG: hypothetical protein AB7O66_01230 [Limisphaerales bacterium]
MSSPDAAPTLVLVCFAVPEEAAPFRAIALPAAHGPVEILVTGMGSKNARSAFLNRLQPSQPTQPTQPTPGLVLTCGFAGGLDPALARGTVVHDADPNAHADTGLELASHLLQSGSRPVRFHCAPRVATSRLEKRALRESTHADAVEMESGIIRELCRERGIPAATVRVISDAANDDLPLDFNALMSADMKLDFRKLAAHLLLHPRAIPGLIRLRRHTADAARRLADVLARLVLRQPGTNPGTEPPRR